MGSPAVIFKNNFLYDWYVGGADYYDYLGRPEAFESKDNHSLQEDNEELMNNLIDHNYDYFVYMKNEHKSDGLFDNENNLLSQDKIDKYREYEKQSQKEGCPKYIWIVSFDNKFLEENGLMVKGRVDLNRLKDVARKGANSLIHSSKKLDNDNTYWTAAIHTNEDNIHIHYSVCEYHRLEDRRVTYAGKGQDTLELSAMRKMKSVIANDIVGKTRTPELTAFKRENLIPTFASTITASKDIKTLVKKLPPKPPHSAWKYDSKAVKPFQADINECIDKIINSNEHLKKIYEMYVDALQDMTKNYEHFYGEKSQATAYAQNQLDDFYNRAGNKLLQAIAEMSEADKPAPVRAYLKKEEKEDFAEYKRLVDDKEYVRAADVLKKHIDNPTFEYNLARLYADKFIGVYQERGFEMLKKIADDPKHYSCDKANMYISKKYLREHDYINAEKSLIPLAEKGNIYSQYSLGKLYLREESRDIEKAAYWLKKSADNGNAYAQCAFGLLCVKSDNQVQRAVGYHYLGQAMLGGNQFAYNYLQSNKADYKKYNPKVRTVAKALRPTQVKKAVSNYRSSVNECWNIIKKMMGEYESHIKQLQREFEYENNVVVDEYDVGYEYSID